MEHNSEFSAKEREVIRLLLQGLSNKQISTALHISLRTVEFHLTHIYQKLGIASRAEAIVRFTQAASAAEHDLRESTVDLSAQNIDNQMKLSSGGVVVKKRLVIAAGGLLLFAILVYFVLFVLFKPAPGNTVDSNVVGLVVEQTLSAMPPVIDPGVATSIPTGHVTTVPSALTFEQTEGTTTYRLTVNWFYLDSTRAEIETTLCGLPAPAGFEPIQVIQRQDLSLKKSGGEEVPLMPLGIYGAGDGSYPDPAGGGLLCFNQVDGFTLAQPDATISQVEPYHLTLIAGGETGSKMGEVLTLPRMSFGIDLSPTFQGNLSFTGEKSAQIADKPITLNGFRVNPHEIIADLCVESADSQQWIPETSLVYGGEFYSQNGWGMESGDSDRQMCYAIHFYGLFNFTDSADAQHKTSLILTGLVQDQPEGLAPERVADASYVLAAQGIEVEVVTGDHGRRIDIVKMPEGMALQDAQVRVQQAFTTGLASSQPIIFSPD